MALGRDFGVGRHKRSMMRKPIDDILIRTGAQFKEVIHKDARHYLEVSLGGQAKLLGVDGLQEHLKGVPVIVPLKQPLDGMKVRIDGRTFKNYRQFDFGLAVPGYVARESDLPGKTYVPHDSMVLNFN